MADQSDVRRIALSLPETSEDEDHFAFAVRSGSKGKGIAWVWLERLEPKKARVPQPAVIAIRVASQVERRCSWHRMRRSSSPSHYNGFPAVLVRLAAIDAGELAELITDAWRCQAPKALVKEFARRDEG